MPYIERAFHTQAAVSKECLSSFSVFVWVFGLGFRLFISRYSWLAYQLRLMHTDQMLHCYLFAPCAYLFGDGA